MFTCPHPQQVEEFLLRKSTPKMIDVDLEQTMTPLIANRNILIVEADCEFRFDLQDYLLNLGYRIEGSLQTYKLLCHALQHSSADLIIMSICIDEARNSLEIAHKIYDEYRIPIVFLIDETDQIILNQILSTHPFGCLSKPFKECDLDAAIHLALLHSETERKLETALRKAQESSKLKSESLSIASHEVRNPLASMMMIFEMLIQHGQYMSAEACYSHLRRGKEMVKDITQLLDDILLIGEIENNQFECHPVPIDVSWFCRHLIEDVQTASGNRNQINFVAENQNLANTYFYNIDPKLLRHILQNLLSNSIKYSPPGSEIRLLVRGSVSSISFYIQDQGIGIPPSDLSKIFGAFNRASNVNSIEGTGLGLFIVKQCIEAHGGVIDINSKVNHGTIVSVTLQAQAID